MAGMTGVVGSIFRGCSLLALLLSGNALAGAAKNQELFAAVHANDVGRAKRLLQATEPDRPDVNATDPGLGLTPLHVAASRGNATEMIDLLLGAGANVNAKAKYGLTPLHLAASHPVRGHPSQGQDSTVRLLLDSGADYTVKDANGWTAADLARRHRFAGITRLLKGVADGKRWEPHHPYADCHAYVYHQITGQRARRYISYADLVAELQKHCHKTFVKPPFTVKLKDLDPRDLHAGDVILIGQAHSGIVRVVGGRKLVFHFRGSTAYHAGKPGRRSSDFGLHCSTLAELCEMKKGKPSYGETTVAVRRSSARGCHATAKDPFAGTWQGTVSITLRDPGTGKEEAMGTEAFKLEVKRVAPDSIRARFLPVGPGTSIVKTDATLRVTGKTARGKRTDTQRDVTAGVVTHVTSEIVLTFTGDVVVGSLRAVATSVMRSGERDTSHFRGRIRAQRKKGR